VEWQLIVRTVTAILFASATAYWIWKIEWFDVFRWGTPAPRLLVVYAAYVAALGTAGWFLAVLFTPRKRSDEAFRRSPKPSARKSSR
jgi:hypothetical protein